MQYHRVLPLSRGEAEAFLAGDDPAAINQALLSITFHDPDWRWVQGHCLRLAHHPSSRVRSLAGLCFGHLARIHRELDLPLVLPVLHELTQHPDTRGQAEDALSDIGIFLHRPRQHRQSPDTL